MIFIDSSYYIARLIEDDKFHKRAIELESQLNEKRYINSTVLNETLNAFGSMGEGYVRFALVLPVEEIQEMVEVIDASGILG